MRTRKSYPLLLLAAVISVFAACQKGNSGQSSTSDATSSTTGVIGITTTAALADSTSSTTKDSVYLIGCYGPHNKKDTIAAGALPSGIDTYLAANYSGYTFVKAYKISDATGTVVNYIVVISYNSSLVGLKFTVDGVFLNVLEQRAGADLKGPGFHHGGPFGNREGLHKDTVAISALPTAVSTYFAATYPTDTLLHAVITANGNVYILISKNTTLYATAITTAGKLVERVQIDARPAKHVAVLASALPAAITTYLTSTYPGYVFDKAFSATNKSGVLEYSVFITSNSTRYAVRFDASGTFIKAIALR